MERAGEHVAVVVLGWQGREDTLTCLDSLARLRRRGRLTTIVVDNDSDDGTAEAVAQRHPWATVLRLPENLGFSEGNNVGIRRALAEGADHVLLLNNDTVVDPDMVTALCDEAARRPDAAALCPLIFYAEPPDVIWYAGAEFDPSRGHNGRQTGYGERDDGRYREVRAVGRASGAAMLVPRAVLEDVGLLDTAFFLHVEDVEWSLRARASGRRIYVVPEARMWHRVSIASGGEQSETIAYYAIRNTLETCRRHAPLTPPRAALREAETVAAHVAHARRSRHPVRNVRAVLAGWRDFHDGRFGPRDRPPLEPGAVAPVEVHVPPPPRPQTRPEAPAPAPVPAALFAAAEEPAPQRVRRRPRRAAHAVLSAVLALGVLAWAAGISAGTLGFVAVPKAFVLLVAVPAILCAGAWRKGSPPGLRRAAAAATITAAAIAGAWLVQLKPHWAIGAPIVFVAALLVRRFPSASLGACFALTACYGSLTAFGVLPGFDRYAASGPPTYAAPGYFADAILAGLFSGVVWSYVVNRRAGRARPWAGLVLVALYLLVSAFQILTAGDFKTGMDAFRGTEWFILAAVTVGLAPWPTHTRLRIARSVVAVGIAVAGYALVRKVIGAAEAERSLARAANNYANIDLAGQFGLVGSFANRHDLGAWCATIAPFCLACAIGLRGRWRVLAAVAAPALLIVLLMTEVRIALAAVVVGGLAAFALAQAARAWPGLRLGAVALVLSLAAITAVAGLVTSGGEFGSPSERYGAIIHPGSDYAFQERQIKWRTAIEDISRHPFGQGLGTAGNLQEQRGDLVNSANVGLDNSYLKLAFEQGFGVMVFFVLSALLLLAGLIRRLVLSTDPERVTLAIGACGALSAMLVLYLAGIYIQGFVALAGWIVVGLGVGQFAAPEPDAAAPAVPARAREADAQPALLPYAYA